MRDLVPGWPLVHPADVKGLRCLPETRIPRTVVWLDELQTYLVGGLSAGDIRSITAVEPSGGRRFGLEGTVPRGLGGSPTLYGDLRWLGIDRRPAAGTLGDGAFWTIAGCRGRALACGFS